MATTLYDQNGQPVEVEDAHLTKALVSGQYGTDKTSVAVKTTSGSVYDVPVANLGKFSASMGGKVQVLSDAQLAEHQKELQRQKDEEKFGGLGYQLEAAGTSALSSATFGGSDFVLGGVLNDQQKADLEAAKRANPNATIAGGIGGIALQLALSGGASAEAAPEELAAIAGERALAGTAETAVRGSRVADALGTARSVISAPTRAADAVSSTLTRGINKGLTAVVGEDGTSMAGAMARKAISRAGGDGVIGALTTGTQELGENQLSTDHNLTGEQLAQHMLVSGLIGVGTGGFFGAAHELGDRLAPRLDRKADEVLFDFLGGKKAEELRKDLESVADKKTIKEMRSELLESEVIGKADKIQDVVPKLEGYAEKQRANLKSLTEKVSDEEAAKLSDVYKALDSVKDKDLLPSLTRGASPIEGLKKDIADVVGFVADDAAKTKVIETKRSKDEIREFLKTGGWDGVSDPSIKREVITPKSADEALANHKVSVGELQEISEAIGKKAVGNEKLLEVQQALDDIIHGKLDELGLKDAVEASKKVQAADVALHYAAKTADSLTEHGEHGIGEAVGHAALGAALHSALGGAGHAAAHAAGAFSPHGLGLLAVHAAGKTAQQIVKERGQSVAIHMLDALSSARAVQNAQRRYSTSMTRAINSLTSNERQLRARRDDFEANSSAVKAMLKDPQGHTQDIAAHAASLGPRFQTTASAYQKTAISSSLYLAQALPKEKPINPNMPRAGVIKPSIAEQQKFNSVFSAVHDPIGIVHDAASGILTQAQVDAVAATHPATLADIRQKVGAEMKQLKEPLAPSQMASIKLLLGQPIFDHPIQLPPPPPPPQQGGSKRAKSATSRPLKLDVNASVGLPGSRIPKS